MTRNSSLGFTIVELMIATTVFAVVLIIAQTSFVQIGHLFYRGVSIINTQEVADHIYQDVSGNFQNAPGFTSVKTSPASYDYYCIGNTRYTYRLDNEVNTDVAANHSVDFGNYGILKDILQGTGSECPAPCDDAAATCVSGVALKNPTELLGDKMRVEFFDIRQSAPTSNLYNIQVVIAYGDTDTLTYKTPGDLKTVSCQSDANNSFCAVSSVNTAIYKSGRQ